MANHSTVEGFSENILIGQNYPHYTFLRYRNNMKIIGAPARTAKWIRGPLATRARQAARTQPRSCGVARAGKGRARFAPALCMGYFPLWGRLLTSAAQW